MSTRLRNGLATLSWAIVVAVMIAAALPAQAQRQRDSGDLRKFDIRDVREIIADERFQDIQQRGENAVSFKRDGQVYVMFIMKDGDLQLYYAIKKAGVQHAHINTWNRDKRLSRAYIDKEGDPVVESDLLSDAGISRGQIVEFIKVFMLTTKGFRDHIADSGRRR